MRFVRSTIAIAIAAAGVLAATGSPAAAANLIADFSCVRGAGTYECEVKLVNPPPGRQVPPSFAGISWFVDSLRVASANQRTFLAGTCVAGTAVDVRVKVTDPTVDTKVTGDPPYDSDPPEIRVAQFRCLHIEPPSQVPAPIHGLRQ